MALGLALTTFPNRKNFDYIFARHQNGFLVNVVRPLFDVFTKLTDLETRESVISSAAENGDAWSRRENEHNPKGNKSEGNGDKPPGGDGKDGSPNSVAIQQKKHSGKLSRQNTMGWMKEFKQSNLTMLTYNAMEMKGLDVPLEEDYGADDEARAMVGAVQVESSLPIARKRLVSTLEPMK